MAGSLTSLIALTSMKTQLKDTEYIEMLETVK